MCIIAEGLVFYDEETEEVCITDYFVYGHEPLSGIGFSYYRKDLKKIESKFILDALKEYARRVDICEPFFAAMSEVIPNLNRKDFCIRENKKNSKGNKIEESKEVKVKSDAPDAIEEENPELPF